MVGRDDFGWVQRTGVRHPMFWEQHDHQWFWRGQFDRLPLPPAWPVYVSHAEASAFARWRGRRLPTEAEFHRAAYVDIVPCRPFAKHAAVETA